MRDRFHSELEAIDTTVVQLADLVADAIVDATRALLAVDLDRAEAVILGDTRIGKLGACLDVQIQGLIARQQPVAGDLRRLVSALRISADLERMGDLAVHVAKNARLRYPDRAIPDGLRGIFEPMAAACANLAAALVRILESRDVEAARQLAQADDVVDRLHSRLFAVLSAPPEPYRIETAIDAILLGRYYERFADHAVQIGKCLEFMVTGTDGLQPVRSFALSGH